MRLEIGNYALRPIEERDLALLLEWRNSERIHAMMLTDHKITWEEHQNWFRTVVQKQAKPGYFVFVRNEEVIGYVSCTDVDFKNRRCSFGIYIGNVDHEIDAGTIMGYLGCAYIFEILQLEKISTIILTRNKKIYEADKFLGYKEEGFLKRHFYKDGTFLDAYLVALFKEDWLEKREVYRKTYGDLRIVSS